MNKEEIEKIKKKKEIEKKNGIKYCHLVSFGNCLDVIISDCEFIIKEQEKEYIEELSSLEMLALSILLMDECNFRVGNSKYTNSTGLLTIETKHVDIDNNVIKFNGKKQVENKCNLKNAFLIKHIRQVWDYVDNDTLDQNKKIFSLENGTMRVYPNDLNKFLQLYDRNFSAKIFRTWKANKYFFDKIKTLEIPHTLREFQSNIKTAIEHAAKHLYHTPAICKRAYIDNRLIDLYKQNPEAFIAQNLTDIFKSLCN
jgi:DNA topoisomerase IB